MYHTRFFKSASALAIVMAVSAPAYAAADADALVEALKQRLANNAIVLTVDSAEADGDNVILSGVTITPGEANPAEIEEIVLQNVEEDDDGFRVGLIEAPEFVIDKEGKKLDFGGATFEGLIIAKDSSTDAVLKNSMLLESAEFGPVEASENGETVFKMDGAAYSVSPYEQGAVMESALEINGMEADMTKLPDEKSRAVMAALGYSKLRGDITLAASWDPSTGQVKVSEYKLDVDDAAALNITLDISGFTPEVIAQFADLNRKKTSGEMNEQAMGFAMMGLMQQMTFNGAEIRIDDASLTGKVLDFVAAQQGANRGDLVNMVKGMMPIMLAQMQNPAFSAQVSEAAGAYLDDPQSLTITAAPASPVPASQIMGAAMGAPGTIPDVLGVTIKANDCGTITC